MRIVDARSGKDVKTGEVVCYPDGEWWELVAIEPGIFWAVAIVHDHETGGGGVTKRVRMPVRYLHHNFLFQRVAFFPS